MEGFLLFEASLVATTLVCEPMMVVLVMTLVNVLYTGVLSNDVFFIFYGSFWPSMFAYIFKWKPKRTDMITNVLEAASVVSFTCVILPHYVGSTDIIRLHGSILLYIFVTQRIEPSIMILTCYLLIS